MGSLWVSKVMVRLRTYTIYVHDWSKIIGQKILHIPSSRSILVHFMQRQHSNCNYITFKLILVRAEDNQRWWQIQNLMPSPRQHVPEPMVISMPYGRRHAAWKGQALIHLLLTYWILLVIKLGQKNNCCIGITWNFQIG